jgi:hypothetical protein
VPRSRVDSQPMTSPTLLIPDKADVERDAVADAWRLAGGSVIRVARFWDPPPVDREVTRVYGADAFCLVLAEKLRLTLVSPNDRVLSTATESLLRRRVRVVSLGQLRPEEFPVFVKPVMPKQFRGAVYSTLESLAAETHGLDGHTEAIVSDVVNFVAEARAFVLDAVVRTCAVYEGRADQSQAAKFAERVVMALELPRTCVVDVGLLDDGSWALVECNATWGAGLNGCNAERAVDCVAAASGPSS